jgi:AraC-like DNA-binding protein
MVFRQHVASEPLARYVDRLWFYADLYPPHRREHVLPDGTFELIVDLRDEPRRLFDRGGDNRETLFRRAWISGAHSQYIIIDALPGSSMIGAHFKPGGAAAVLGLPADELRDQVVELEAIWGSAGIGLRDRLLAARGPQAKFATLERWLLQCLERHKSDTLQQQRVFWARDRLLAADPPRISDVVAQLGISHRRFIDEFRSHVGLTPKRFCRIRRFQQVVAQVAARKAIDWADLAYTCGYFDQAHFANDFRAFSGFRPTEYVRKAAGESMNFVPIDEAR